ncbi:hypothetical protein P692DRAFT_20830817 [Suillus brevipes Sb2]|nr:hypothetical protein P692DRAFT_20830817 [Suillus brevipes Sb2]
MVFARHIAFKIPALRTNVLSSSSLISSAFVATRRTFFTTRRIQLPAAASKSASKSTTEGTIATKAAPKKARAKKALPRRVSKSERPPVRSPSGFILFFSRLAKTREGEIKNMTGIQGLSKQAAAKWNNMTIAEKKPYLDEAEILKKQYKEKLDEYWKTASWKTVREINARRKHEGRTKIHRPHQESDSKRPKATYLRFLEDFRRSDEGRAILEAGLTPTGRAVVNVARAAGERWRAMSASDKAPYVKAFRKAIDEWEADQLIKSGSL